MKDIEIIKMPEGMFLGKHKLKEMAQAGWVLHEVVTARDFMENEARPFDNYIFYKD